MQGYDLTFEYMFVHMTKNNVLTKINDQSCGNECKHSMNEKGGAPSLGEKGGFYLGSNFF